MPFFASCPSCGAQFSLADEMQGKTLRCGRCQKEFTATAEPAAPSVLPAAPQPMGRPMPRYDDEPDYSQLNPELSWIDKQFKNTSMVILILFPFCCGGIALIFGIIGLVTCKHPTARRNAIIVTCISAFWFVMVFLNTLIRSTLLLDGQR